MSAIVRVLLVDDSPTHRFALRKMLEQDKQLEVIGVATDGLEAVEATARLRPDVVLMDVRMPTLDGLEATRRIMSTCPVPILLMTAARFLHAEVELAMRAMEYGALDLVPKPDMSRPGIPDGRQLGAHLRLLAQVPVISHPQGMRAGKHASAQQEASASTTYHRRARRLVAVCASTGGPRALQGLLRELPAKLPAAVVVVQHIDVAFQDGLVSWLNDECALNVLLAEDQQQLFSGHVYLAPQGRMAEVTGRRRLALVKERVPRGGHCPSGDRLLTTAGRAYKSEAVGIVLTGMGVDGAAGLLEMRKAGSVTIAQDEESSVIYGMPRVAKERGAAQRVLPLDEIGAAILECLK